MTRSTRTMYVGTVEYLSGSITADLQVTDSDTIEVSLDRGATWVDAEWVGAAGTTRQWRLLLGDTTPLPDAGSTSVYVRVNDNPEAPLIRAGSLNVVNL